MSGLTTWADIFEKAAHNPDDYKRFYSDISGAASGSAAAANGLISPRRNQYERLQTDLELYALYNRSAEGVLEKQKQCTVDRKYTPEEICDCVAGFPGDTAIGPGAGELVLSSNYRLAVRACGTAAQNATDPVTKGRYTAQRARAQLFTDDEAQAMQWADDAIALGYGRARIVKAAGPLRVLEVWMGGFPPPTQAQFNEQMNFGATALKAAKAAGIRESYIVARSYTQFMARVKFNVSVLTPIYKAMTAPPAPGPKNCRVIVTYPYGYAASRTDC